MHLCKKGLHNFILLGGGNLTTHGFGIMDEIMYNVDYVYYEPEEYSCIFINDDFIEEIIHNYLEGFKNMETYAHSTNDPGWGLNYCGITLIPPKALQKFSDIITSANNQYKSQELELLINMISEAMRENKFLIHYGI